LHCRQQATLSQHDWCGGTHLRSVSADPMPSLAATA
jgi:hypothetical protein